MTLTTNQKISLAGVILLALTMTGGIFYFLFISWNPIEEYNQIYLNVKLIYLALWIFFLLIFILFFIKSDTKKVSNKKTRRKK